MGKVEIGNFYCLIGDKRILFLQKSLLNSSSHFIRLLSELLNLIGCRGRGIFYSNASCFSLLWLYLGNSQVSVYRTIGPTLVQKLLQPVTWKLVGADI